MHLSDVSRARQRGVRALLGVVALLLAVLGAHAAPTATVAHHPAAGSAVAGFDPGGSFDLRATTGDSAAGAESVGAERSGSGQPAEPATVTDCLLFLGGLAGVVVLVAAALLRLLAWHPPATCSVSRRLSDRCSATLLHPTLTRLCILRV